MARLFLATLLSEANFSTLQVVRDSVSKLTPLDPDNLRWTTDAKLHLTWLFLGNLNEERLGDVQTSLKAFASRKREDIDEQIAVLNLDQAEIWHADGVPRHLVLTPSSIPNRYDQLVGRIRDSFLAFVEDAFKRQAQRAPRPHVTIAHFKRQGGQQLGFNFSPPLDNHPLQNSDPSLVGVRLPVSFKNPLALRLDLLALIESSNDGSTNHYRTIESVALGP